MRQSLRLRRSKISNLALASLNFCFSNSVIGSCLLIKVQNDKQLSTITHA